MKKSGLRVLQFTFCMKIDAQCYRVTFAQRNIVREHYVSDSATYLKWETPTTLMNYNDQAGQFIGFWIVRLRNTRNAAEPLPDANVET